MKLSFSKGLLAGFATARLKRKRLWRKTKPIKFGLLAGFATARLKLPSIQLNRYRLWRLAGGIRDGAIETFFLTEPIGHGLQRLAGGIRDGAIETNGVLYGYNSRSNGLLAGFATARLKHCPLFNTESLAIGLLAGRDSRRRD